MEASDSREVKTTCAATLAFLVNDTNSIFEEFINAGAITVLLSQLQISGDVLLLETSKAFLTLAKVENVTKTLVEQGIVSQMVDILVHTDIQNLKIKENAILIMSKIVKFPSNLPQIKNDLLPLVCALIEQLKSSDLKLRKPAQNLLSKLAHHFPELPRIMNHKEHHENRKFNLKNTHILYIKISPNIDIDYDAHEDTSEDEIAEEDKLKKKDEN